jgi:hypothetical protein
MTKTNERSRERDNEATPHRVILPRFITDEDIGLGEVVKKMTSYVGLKPCSGCQRRAAMLNRWVVFRGRVSSRSRRG